MNKIKCQSCGHINISYSVPRFCQSCHTVFMSSVPIKQPDTEQAKKPQQKPVKAAAMSGQKPGSRKKPLTIKQKKYYETLSDNMQSAKRAMSRHIIDKINSGYYSISEFLNDPGSYLDTRIMGKFFKNSVMRKQIIKAVEYEIYGGIL